MEFNSFGPAVGRLGSDSSRGGKVEAGGLSPPHFNHWTQVLNVKNYFYDKDH